MIVAVRKGGYRKKGPKIINYRNYAKFCAEDFRKDLYNQTFHFIHFIFTYLNRVKLSIVYTKLFYKLPCTKKKMQPKYLQYEYTQ